MIPSVRETLVELSREQEVLYPYQWEIDSCTKCIESLRIEKAGKELKLWKFMLLSSSLIASLSFLFLSLDLNSLSLVSSASALCVSLIVIIVSGTQFNLVEKRIEEAKGLYAKIEVLNAKIKLLQLCKDLEG